ncbi:MAG: epoxyqueuosine reductase QueH [Anaerolineae bacterium]|nr:epoxyqueuosine reductase QueH [Anaerolineae bacterium]
MTAIVLDLNGQQVSSTSDEKARRLIEQGKATLVSDAPLTVRLTYAIDLPAKLAPEKPKPVGEGRRILLHICCAPCATYTAKRLRERKLAEFEAFDVTGYWYNPNVHPFSEHERRRETLARYAAEIDLPVIWEPGYEMVEFLRAVNGREQFGERCKFCYQMRLARTAQIAAREGFDAFTTTLLISPYQNQQAIKALGEAAAAQHGVEFFFENFRRGWAEHSQMVREHDLYSQRYCGCVYSEWEALDRKALTLKGPL